MSQFQTAKAMRFNKGHMSRILRGERAITDSFLWRFQETFVCQTSPFYLPGADSVLHEIKQHRT